MFTYSKRFHKYKDTIYENVTLTKDINRHLKTGDVFYHVYFHEKTGVYDFWVNPPDPMMGEISPNVRLKF